MSDTLQLLGKLATENAGRDAVHIAVAPVIAAHILQPGESVGWADDERQTVGRVPTPFGIVDPFLATVVMPGQRFYVFLYPQTISSLRHVWQHIAFPDEGFAVVVAAPPQDESQKWIGEFAAKLGYTYDRLMGYAERWVCEEGDWDSYVRDDTESYKDYYNEFPTFWAHYEKVTGKKPKDASCFFTCSC